MLVIGAPVWFTTRGASGSGSADPAARAVPAARDAGLTDDVPAETAGELIERMCASDGSAAGIEEAGRALGSVAGLRSVGLRASIQALGAGAAERCPDVFTAERGPAVLDALQCFAVDAFVRSNVDGPSSRPAATCRLPPADAR